MNTLAVLATLPIFWPILQIIIYFAGKEDKLVKFYAIQTILFGLVCFGIGMIGAMVGVVIGISTIIIGDLAAWIGMALGLAMAVFGLIVALVCLFQIFKAFKGEVWKMPVIGNFSAKKAGL